MGIRPAYRLERRNHWTPSAATESNPTSLPNRSSITTHQNASKGENVKPAGEISWPPLLRLTANEQTPCPGRMTSIPSAAPATPKLPPPPTTSVLNTAASYQEFDGEYYQELPVLDSSDLDRDLLDEPKIWVL
ncbi:hypothetical protein HK104_008326 [Borealophlyctis nickersoniae]|nr:hypothetical protein HK104_008326 [Borealophlyctis nickersoniae]